MWESTPYLGRKDGWKFGMGEDIFANNPKFMFQGLRVISLGGMFSLYLLQYHSLHYFSTFSSLSASTIYTFSSVGNPLRSFMNLCLFSLEFMTLLNISSSLNQAIISSLIAIGGYQFIGV